MKTLLQFGAGKIARSVMAPRFVAAGYRVIFVDTDRQRVETLNRVGGYDLVIREPEENETIERIDGLRALHIAEHEAILAELARANVVATSVGQAGLATLLPLLMAGAMQRKTPIDVILAENIPDSADWVRGQLVAQGFTTGAPGNRIGWVQASVDRITPEVDYADNVSNSLVVHTEKYSHMVVDRFGFLNEPPPLPGLEVTHNIRAFCDRKLFILNLGHCAVAYLGHQLRPQVRYINDAISNADVLAGSHSAMLQAAAAICSEYPQLFEPDSLQSYVDQSIHRFRNAMLKDTLYRVGRSLARKLGRRERLIGPAVLAAQHSLALDSIANVIRAAMHFNASNAAGQEWPEDSELLVYAREHGEAATVRKYAGLNPCDPRERAVLEMLI